MSEIELLELVPDIRKLLDATAGEGAQTESELSNVKGILKDVGKSMQGELSKSFDKLSEELKLQDGQFRVGDTVLSNSLSAVLRTGDLSSIFELAGAESSEEVKELTEVFRKITSDIPERKIAQVANESATQFKAIASEESTLKEIDRVSNNPKEAQQIIMKNSKLSNVNRFFQTVKNVTVITAVGGIAVFLGVTLGEYISNYIKAKSGAFLVTTDSQGNLRMQKIRKYSCVSADGAIIDHPFDDEITKYLKGKDPCSESATYGPCAGWANVGAGSRLYKAGIDVSKLGTNKTLQCTTATTYDAIFDLANNFVHKVGDLVKGAATGVCSIFWSFVKPFSPLLAAFAGLIGAGLSYFLTGSMSTWTRLGIAVAVGIVVALITYFILVNLKVCEDSRPTTTYGSEPESYLDALRQQSSVVRDGGFLQYMECPACRRSYLQNEFPKFSVITLT